jgi:arsenate reductase
MTYKAVAEPGVQIERSLDERRALKSAAQRLHSEFAGTATEDAIERFLYSSYNQLADNATLHDFLVLLAERFARHRLRALANLEVKLAERKPIVLFLCNHNAGRSQMAEAFFNHLAGDAAIGWSGGSQPGDEIEPAAVAAMAERGINIADEIPKPWTDEIIQAADVVVTMGCGDAMPRRLPGRRTADWILDDPGGKDVAAVRPIRDEIERHVRQLIAELGLPCRI